MQVGLTGDAIVRNDEVVGSIPTSSTIVSNEVPSCKKKRHSRVATLCLLRL